tara:strand:+ start:35722 stop:36321 length:600 start_codon:yes stop_codon:yes gene_type:complete
MIELDRLNKTEPYKKFYYFYDNCIKNKQLFPEAIVVSTYDSSFNQVDSRYVNLKYVLGDEWIFFTNYNSPKGIQIKSHNQISVVIFWNCINVQIRIKAKIRETSKTFSDSHFAERSYLKNALAISSKQSSIIQNYEKVKQNYDETLKNKTILSKRPSFWGGYSFTPYEIEFWEGESSRINKREKFIKKRNIWKKYFLEP